MPHGGREMWRSALANHLPEGDCLRILDIGTGPGFFAILLTEMGHQVTAADYTPRHAGGGPAQRR